MHRHKETFKSKDDIADALAVKARVIALIEPDPVDWGWWVIYLIEKMESEARKRVKGPA